MKNVETIVQYWVKTAKHDYETMNGLFGIKRYSDCLFYGHIVLEKILKALIIQKTKQHPMPIHNLLVLYKNSEIRLEKEDVEFLAVVNKFNIKARYPDYKLEFYKTCTLKYTQVKLDKICLLYKKLCQILKKEKKS